jgi:hypothetical protein|tara:strand:- start:5654 stop:5875 length:222 start_codon:yes stop_codon:yes gene_type:complete
MISKKTILRRDSITWTKYLLTAVEKAKLTGDIVTLEIGKESSANLLQHALTALALRGNDAAFDVEIKLHKHLH